MKIIPGLVASGATLAITGGVAFAANSHGGQTSDRPTARVVTDGHVVTASVKTTNRSTPVPAISAQALKKLSRHGVTVRRVPSAGRSGVVPLGVVGRQSSGFEKAVKVGRVHASLARVSIANFGKVSNPSSTTKVTVQQPEVDGDLAWVITYTTNDFEFTMPTSVAAEIENPDPSAQTETVSASAVSVYDAVTGDFLYWSVY